MKHRPSVHVSSPAISHTLRAARGESLCHHPSSPPEPSLLISLLITLMPLLAREVLRALRPPRRRW